MAFTSETARLAGRKGSRNGVKNQKTVAWETLSESITRQHAEKFNEYMNNLWRGDDNDKFKAAQLYLKTLDFFKTKDVKNNH